MPDIATQFNAYNFRTYPHRVQTVSTDIFTPNIDLVYLVRAIRVTNFSANADEITLIFYDGQTDTEFFAYEGKNILAHEERDLLLESPIVLRGDQGDRLRAFSAGADKLDLLATAMILGRQSGL